MSQVLLSPESTAIHESFRLLCYFYAMLAFVGCGSVMVIVKDWLSRFIGLVILSYAVSIGTLFGLRGAIVLRGGLLAEPLLTILLDLNAVLMVAAGTALAIRLYHEHHNGELRRRTDGV